MAVEIELGRLHPGGITVSRSRPRKLKPARELWCRRLVIRRHVLAALADGVQAADDEIARLALADIDWALRGLARRRLEHALLDATLAAGTDERVEATRHRLRAAALIAARVPCELGDARAVADAYARLAVAPPPRLPIATGLVATLGLLLAMLVSFTMVRVVTAGAANGEFTRPDPPAPGGAYRTGGAAIADAAIEQVLAVELPALEAVRVTDEAERARRVAALRTHGAFAAHGRALAEAWRAMIDTHDRWRELGASATASHRDAARLSRELAARVAVVSDQLAARGLGYFVEVELGDDSRRTPGLYAFRVEDVAFVLRGDDRVRVLGVRRINPADRGDVTVLGMTTSEPRDPIVLLDEVEDKVRTQILPVLGGQPYFLGDDSWARTVRGRQVAAAASAAIRRELHTALGFDVASLERATARCRKLVAASIRHHEAQHGFDRGRPLPYPPALAPHAGPASSEFAVRTRYELSGYLSQIASDTWLPQLTLWNLSRHAFRRSAQPVEEAYVAVFVIEGLARHLKIASPGPVVHRGAIDRDRLAALVLPLSERSTTELRSAAAALWAEAFGERLVRIVDDL